MDCPAKNILRKHVFLVKIHVVHVIFSTSDYLCIIFIIHPAYNGMHCGIGIQRRSTRMIATGLYFITTHVLIPICFALTEFMFTIENVIT